MAAENRVREQQQIPSTYAVRSFPTGMLLISLLAILLVRNGSYATVFLAVIWAPYLVLRPRAGLWFATALVMAASFLAVPPGYIAGWGYSPELIFWAVAVCIVFAATTFASLGARAKLLLRGRRAVQPPIALHVFMGVSVVSAAMGLERGYVPANVAKQFFGCLLFVGYFWFALRLTPSVRSMKRSIMVVVIASLVSGLAYAVIWVPTAGLVRDTVLNDFAASAACLLLPQFLTGGRGTRTRSSLMITGLLAAPLVDTFKRSIGAFGVCVVLVYGFQSVSRKRRYVWLLGSLTVFALLIATPVLDYAGRAVESVPVVSKLIPADVESNYSVYGRLSEAAQKLEESGGPSLLGTGLGSSLSWFDPYAGEWFTEETIALGWAYMLIKMGIAGVVVFVWLLGTLLFSALQDIPRGIHLAVVLVVAFFAVEMVGSPVMVYFATAPWIGAACGWLHMLNERARVGRMVAAAAA